MTTSETLELLYVIDTHALIWYLLGDKKLSNKARAVFEAGERGDARLVLPAVVLAELYFANVKNKWFPDFKTVYTTLAAHNAYTLLPFESRHVLEFDADAKVPEMHDRIIVGVARRLRAPLVTSDPLIVAADIVPTVW